MRGILERLTGMLVMAWVRGCGGFRFSASSGMPNRHSTALNMRIIGMDGSVVMDGSATASNDWFSTDGLGDIFGSSASAMHQALVERLQKSEIASMARLASRWARPGGLAVVDISQVRVASVDRHHVELEVVACEADGCVSLRVPIKFPHTCGDDDDEVSAKL